MARPDLTIMGAGIFGLSIAWAAAQRGANVRVIEAQAIAAGSSGGPVGSLSPHVPEAWNAKKAFQLESLLMAESWWQTVAEASNLPTGYGRTGRLQPLADARAVEIAKARQTEAKTLWRGLADWKVVSTKGGEWEPKSPSGFMVQDTLTARLNPVQALAALAAAITAKGGEITLGNDTPQGPTIWATGADGLADLSAILAYPIGSGAKGQALLLLHDAHTHPQLFVDGLHIVPHANGTVAIGSTSETTWTDPRSTDHQLDALHQKAICACPALANAPIITRWAGLRPRAKSRAPMLGAWPNRPGHFIANGGFKIGFGMAAKVAEVMADLVLNGHDTIPADFRIVASLPLQHALILP
jgi:glycine oxidase